MKQTLFLLLLLLWFLPMSSSIAYGAGHGPLFGYATPVNSQGEWIFDLGVIGRNTSAASEVTARSILGYGITPHLQLSFLAPGVLNEGAVAGSRLGGGGDFESDLSWRFHHKADSVGRRFESTATAGLVVPGPQNSILPGVRLRRAPGISSSLVTGVASRSHYVWVGGGYTNYFESGGDHKPNVLSGSLVYGYRPARLRKDYPFWDWRGFAELTAEHTGRMRISGLTIPETGSNQVFAGPSVLGIYKSFAIESGIQFPIHRDAGALFPRERFRVGLNVSYFLFAHKQH